MYAFSFFQVCNLKKDKFIKIYEKSINSSKVIGEIPYNASYLGLHSFLFVNVYEEGVSNQNKYWNQVEYYMLPSNLKNTLEKTYLKKAWVAASHNICSQTLDSLQDKQYIDKIYKVIRHTKNEYLNVRIGRGSNYAIIDRLPYNQTDIKIKTCSKSLKGGKWCWINYTNTGNKKYINNKVNYTNREGWVSAKFLQKIKNHKRIKNKYQDKKRSLKGFSKPFIQNIENSDSMVVSNDGKLLAIVNNKSIKLIDIKTGKLLYTFTGHMYTINTLTFTKDNNYIISASDLSGEHYPIRIWNVKNGKEIDRIGAFDNNMGFVVDFIKSVDNDRSIFMIASGFSLLINRTNHKIKKLKCEFEYGDDSTSVILEPSSNYFYSIYNSTGELYKQNIFSCKAKPLAFRIKAPASKDGEFSDITVSKDGKYLIIFYKNNKINTYDLKNGKLLQTDRIDLKYPRAFPFKKNLLLINDGNSIYSYNFISKRVKDFIKLNNFYINSAKIDVVNNQIIAGGSQGHKAIVSIWDIKDAKLRKVIDVFENDIITDLVITKSSIIISGFDSIKAFDRNNYTLLWSVDNSKNNDSVNKILLSKNKKTFITASDFLIKMRTVKSGKTIKKFPITGSALQSIAFYKDKYIIYSDISDVYLLNIFNGKKTLLFENQSCLNLKVKNNSILCTTLEKDLKILDLNTLRDIKIYTKDQSRVEARLLSREKYITFNTKSGNSLIDLWDTKRNHKLATFAIVNKNSWLIITPEGYFSGSKDAAKYLNITKYTKDGMEPFDFSQLYDHFFRPDLVKLKLSGNEEAYQKAIGNMTYQEALINPPPKISFVSVNGKRLKKSGIDYDVVKTDKNKVKITFNIDAQQGGVGLVRIYQEGKLIKTIGNGQIHRQSANLDTLLEQDQLNQKARENQKEYLASLAKAIDRNISLNDAISKVTEKTAIKNKAGKYTVEIALKSGKNEIGIEAFNKTNTVTSYRESLTINAGIPKHKPKLYAIVAGVNDFEARWASHLKYSVNDARAIKALAEKNINKVFDSVEVKYLANTEVTKSHIYQAIKEISKKAKLEDTILFFISTHGKAYKGRLFLVPHNNKNIANLINFKELFGAVQSINALNQIFVIDACESGEANDIVSSVYDSRASVLAKSSGVHLLLATTRGTSAFESQDPNIKHSLFTYRILKTLKDKHTDLNKDHFISILELSKRLKQTTKNNTYQYPVIRNVGRDVKVERVE